MLFQFVKFLPRKVLFLTLPFILVVASHHIAQASTAAVTQMTKTSSTGNNPETQVSPDLSPEKIDAQLATMDDVQVRQQLAQKLKQDAAAKTLPTARSTPMDLFYRFADAAGAVLKKIGSVFTGAHERSEQWNAAIEKLSGGKGTSHLVGVLFTTALIIAAGLFFKWLFVRSTRDVREQLLQTMHLGRLEFFGRVLSRMLLNAAGVVIYALTTFCLFVLFFRKGDPGYLIAGVYIVVSYYILLFAFAATTIFAPAAGGLRLFPLQERDATFLHRWIIGITIVAGVVTGTAIILLRSGISNQLYLLIYSWAGALVILALMIMIWQSRQRVAEALLGDNAEKDEKVTLGQRLARNWHYLAILYVLLLGIYWVYEVYLERDADIVGLIASIFIIPVFIGLDQWGQRLLKMASGELTEIVDLSDDALDKPVEEPPMAHSKMDIQHYIPLISRCLRIFLVLFLFFVMLRLWGIDLPFGRLFTRSILSILITVVLGLITWQIIKARIDRKLKEEMPESDEDMEEGGAGGSRIGTLLILLRKFVISVLFVIVTMIVLSSLGVNIGPLIAGAGVVGLAIGFGAQTLVQDIIAGIFFLIDDSFRVGDFIETSGTKGMVEHISLRSLRLRSPRGPVHTIPFGSMGTVTNNSRDYIITKLDFRVRYDTDVEKVRKIIKRINVAIQGDPEMGPNLLDKVKSQGVRELDDSAMIMRVKFKTIPGEQFVIRREVFRMIQEMFAQHGIEFAHRNVTVYMPPGEKKEADAEKIAEAGAAAAAAAAAQEEEEAAAAKKPK
ncbi:MAG: mechanosensitive ion channel family protein [Desulfobacterales bacterium]|jgi:small-conductance mechanosensitive channel